GEPETKIATGRGRFLSLVFVLALFSIQNQKKFCCTKERWDYLRSDGYLHFQMTRLNQLSGLNPRQKHPGFSAIASRYHRYCFDIMEKELKDLLTEGNGSLSMMIIYLGMSPGDRKNGKVNLIKERIHEIFLPLFIFMAKRHPRSFLSGSKGSSMYIYYMLLLYYREEILPTLLQNFPYLYLLQPQTPSLPSAPNFLNPGQPQETASN
uniref:Uncharacterized protein n=1 Tax=Neovison vison TaxID=452646 RepID=A0A8C7AXI9_NEOVI